MWLECAQHVHEKGRVHLQGLLADANEATLEDTLITRIVLQTSTLPELSAPLKSVVFDASFPAFPAATQRIFARTPNLEETCSAENEYRGSV